MTTRTGLAPILAAALLAGGALSTAAGCGDDETSGTGGSGGGGTTTSTSTTTTSTSTSTGGEGGAGGGDPGVCGGADTAGCDHVLEPGADDTEALQSVLIDDVSSGDVVCLCPGTFALEAEISLTVPDVTIRGVGGDREAVILDFAGQTTGADGMNVDADGFTIESLTVKNSPGNGIVVGGAENVTFRDLLVTWDGEPRVENGAYAIYPIQCSGVLVEGCEVYGAADAGIYVGQSDTILVRDNVVHGNVAGIEIENSTDAEVVNNEAYDNTAGILVFVLPGLEKKDGLRCKVHQNVIRDNDRDNFGAPGTIVSSVPAGIGMLVLAADVTEIHDNEITGNDSTGIIAVSYQLIETLLGEPSDDPATDPYMTGLYVHDNTFEDNGTDPRSFFIALQEDGAPIENVVWDGIEETEGTGDVCLSADPPTFRNLHGAITPTDGHTTDPTPHACEGEELPPQDF